MSCFVAPGFEYHDVELANRQVLVSQCPRHIASSVFLPRPQGNYITLVTSNTTLVTSNTKDFIHASIEMMNPWEENPNW